MSDEGDWVEICSLPFSIVRLGTLVRIGTSLGWGIDQLAVKHEPRGTVLLRRKNTASHRPPVTVLIELSAEDPEASDADDVEPEPDAPARDEPTPEPEAPAAGVVTPPADELPDHHPDSLYQRTCQKCSKVFATRNGRLIHNGRQHGDNPDYSVIAAAVEAQREEPVTRPRSKVEKRLPVKGDIGGPHPTLRCEEPACGFTTEYAVDMNSHTRGDHQRPPTRTERIPVIDTKAS